MFWPDYFETAMVILISAVAMSPDRHHQYPNHHKESVMFYFAGQNWDG